MFGSLPLILKSFLVWALSFPWEETHEGMPRLRHFYPKPKILLQTAQETSGSFK
jgi:hypothetical protein